MRYVRAWSPKCRYPTGWRTDVLPGATLSLILWRLFFRCTRWEFILRGNHPELWDTDTWVATLERNQNTRTSLTPKELCVKTMSIKGKYTLQTRFTAVVRLERPRIRGRPSRGGQAVADEWRGKRNHEDVSDTMALVQAAGKVLTITARPCAHFRHRVGMRGSVRSRE